jgi:hypothetical protein
LGLVGFAFSVIALALLSLFLLLLDLLGSFAFGGSEGGSDRGGEYFGCFFGSIIETGCWAVLERDICVVLFISTDIATQNLALTSIPFLFFFGRRLSSA